MEKMITTREAAEILGVSLRRVRAMREDGLLASGLKRGRDWFLDEKEVIDLAAKERPAHRPKANKS
jgi:phage terminase Nu1 subunit (DNA packaging protein)